MTKATHFQLAEITSSSTSEMLGDIDRIIMLS